MMKSMTGFGRSKYDATGRMYTIEIKSVNHKYNDVSIKTPRSLSYLEEKIKKTILNSISRGKIDVSISLLNYGDISKEIRINKEVAKIYINQLKELASETGINDNMNIIQIATLPEVLTIENKEDEQQVWGELSIALDGAIKEFARNERNRRSKDC